MKKQTETINRNIYVCEVCHKKFFNDLEAEACEKNHEREKEHAEWFKTHEPKFKVGDLVKDLVFGYTKEIRSIEKHCCKTTFLYAFKNCISDIEEEKLILYMEKEAFKKLTKSIKKVLEAVNLKLEAAYFEYNDDLHLVCTKPKMKERKR